MGSLAQAYVEWLQGTQQLKFSSIANYLNGLVSVTSYVYHTLDPPAETLSLSPTPLTQLINLRGQAEKASRTQQLYDKRTGAMNATVAAYWKEHFDLAAIMARDWATLGPKLQGKLNIFVGNSDTFFLTNAVMDMEDFLMSTNNPSSDATVTIGVHDGRGGQPADPSAAVAVLAQPNSPKLAYTPRVTE